ncbi:MAG: riboflavin biosynthesis protein RibF [Candidatus Promineifilaceae bacterium]
MPAQSQVISGLETAAERRPTYLAIGVFDGVHRGHQALLADMAAAARAAGARPAALTFFPHPSAVISGRSGRFYLCALEERIRLLGQTGVELVVNQPFDQALRQTSARDFVAQLRAALDLRQLWGASFSLGYRREGDLAYLQALGPELGFEVRPYDRLVEWAGRPVSSSRIRDALTAGELDEVAGCLGRPYHLRGRVVRGDGRGRTIGVPTANLKLWDELLLPANGVYATLAEVDGRRYPAATNIGHRPTVDGQSLSVEAHLLDFDADLYGRELELEFVRRLREERKFPGLDALVAQIRADIEATRHWSAPAGRPG